MLIAIVLALLTTVVLVALSVLAPGNAPPASPGISIGQPAPAFQATTLDGAPLSLAAYRGRPVIVNFWGPSCIPCRDEFSLFIDETAAHVADGLALVGVLMFDPPAPAQDFIREHGANWPTVDDPDGAIRTAYRAVARPQTYFIDRDGVLRGIQVGELTTRDFDRFYAMISGPEAATP